MQLVLFLATSLIFGVEGKKNCSENGTVCKSGLLLPVWQPVEPTGIGDRVCRAAVYLLVLLYVFLGVSIIADRFMTSIEVITSKEKEVKVKRISGEEYTVLVRVWNETVSNLTLMALGSSAPEILLSVIETCGSGFEAGELGPGTIVGSAAFNLFIIVGICVAVVPSNEVRRIKHVWVFWVTVTWSLFAYVWLYLILAVISANEIEWWEGVLTFLFFPLTVITAYVADRRLFGVCGGRRYLGARTQGVISRPTTGSSIGPSATEGQTGPAAKDLDIAFSANNTSPVVTLPESEEARLFEEHRAHYLQVFRNLRATHPDAPVAVLQQLAQEEVLKMGPKSRAFYRIKATRQLIGAGNVINKRIHVKEIEQETKTVLQSAQQRDSGDHAEGKGVLVRFEPAHYTCMEDVGTVKVTVACQRVGLDTPCIVQVDYETQNGTAEAVTDFVPVQGTLTFEAGEDVKLIPIQIVDNDTYEEDEHFSIHLSNLRATSAVPQEEDRKLPARLVPPFVATVLIVDNDHAGAFAFESEKFDVSEAASKIKLKVVRTRGARGTVSVPFRTVDGSAKEGVDYVAHSGDIVFNDEQAEAIIAVQIVNDDQYEKAEDFYVELLEPVWDKEITSGTDDGNTKQTDIAELGRPVLGGISRCKVVIQESKEFKSFVDKMLTTANTSIVVGSSSWKQQFKDAISVQAGGDDSADIVEPRIFDYVMHALTLPWKLLFALVPPTDYLGGWLCFVVSISIIGLMTALIGDLAQHFGCTIGLLDTVTAISLVALGTSLPDTFASKTAALSDPNADSSIGNVTGSNAVNVFLGIGVAWGIAAVYHAINHTTFHVPTGSLAFSVTLFCVGAAICVAILQARRYAAPTRGELGGPVVWKVVTVVIFTGIWCLYVVLSSLEAYCIIPGF